MAPIRTESDIKREIIEEEARHATAIEKLEMRLSGPKGPIADHEERLRSLERWQRWMAGIGVSVALVASMLVGIAQSVIADDIRQIRERIVAAPVRR